MSMHGVTGVTNSMNLDADHTELSEDFRGSWKTADNRPNIMTGGYFSQLVEERVLQKAIFRAGVLALGFAVVAGCNGTKEGQENQLPPNPSPPSNLTQPTASFAVTTASVTEGSSVVVQVDLSDAATVAVTVPVTFSGTASGTSVDYSASATPLTIAVGSRSASITINAIDDSDDEPAETIILTMGTPTNANLGTSSATVALIDNDEPLPPGVSGRVTDAATGSGIAGVTVSNGSATATTGSDGSYLLTGVTSAPSVVIGFELDGYVPQSRTTADLATSTAHVVINVPMVAVATLQSLDPTAPIVVTVPGSQAQVLLAANSLHTASAALPSGNVTAEVTPILAAGNLGVMPGNYRGVVAGASGPMETFGGLDVLFTDASGAPLSLAPGTTATVRIPASSRTALLPDTVPMFYFDSVAGTWIQEGTATLMGTIPDRYYEATVGRLALWSVDSLYAPVTVTGCVQDAAGSRVVGATVVAEGRDYAGMAQATTDASGNFAVDAKPNSQAFLQASRGNAISNSPQIQTQSESLAVTECLVLTGGTLSIKLTWGAAPSDLDSHTLGANASDHIFYSARGSLTALPYIGLDVDDVTGFGPEVTTFTRVARDRRYSFYVHNYSGTFTPGQTGSPARVELTTGGAQSVYTPPAGETTATDYWHVFDLTTDANCVITVVPVQQFVQVEPTNANVGNDAAFCN